MTADRTGWRLSLSAAKDIDAIYDHGAATWSVRQADAYNEGLERLFDLLASFPALGREHAEISPPIRIHPYRAHVAIYRFDGDGIEVLRIVPARSDWLDALDR